MSNCKIAVLKGDGIGPEVVESAKLVLEAASESRDTSVQLIDFPIGMEAYKEFGRTLPSSTLEGMRSCDASILGPLQTGSYPKDDKDSPMSSGKIRKYFDLYANIRPVRSFHHDKLMPKIDLVIVRENTEDFFPSINLHKGYGEFWTDKNTVLSLRVIRRSSCERIARTAFEIASTRNKGKLVTAVHKSNVLVEGDGLFLEETRKVANEFVPNIKLEEKLVDSTAMELAMTPEKFDVIVTTNLFGDILSDEAAGLIGGLGICPSLNAGKDYAIAQAVHGTAPDIAGKGVANPVSEILSTVMLLDWLSSTNSKNQFSQVARDIEEAVASQLLSQDSKDKTLDFGGTATTQDFTSRLVRRIREHLPENS
jgi:3-isopropylmalate dehydrogenase